MLLTVFGIKAAVFPMSAWLPDSYPSAPVPVSAVFAGLLTKVGVYAIVRTQFLLFPESPLHTLLMIAGLLTMLVGILGAVAQPGIKRMLSFTLVSHIGYMLFGIGVASGLGLSAAIFYIAHHIIVQTALFLISGLIERVGGSTVINRLGGLAATSPVLAILFFVPAMNLAGIPPFSGFVGKVGLVQAGVADGARWPGRSSSGRSSPRSSPSTRWPRHGASPSGGPAQRRAPTRPSRSRRSPRASGG